MRNVFRRLGQQPRVPAGTPAGGRFAASVGCRSEIDLADGPRAADDETRLAHYQRLLDTPADDYWSKNLPHRVKAYAAAHGHSPAEQVRLDIEFNDPPGLQAGFYRWLEDRFHAFGMPERPTSADQHRFHAWLRNNPGLPNFDAQARHERHQILRSTRHREERR